MKTLFIPAKIRARPNKTKISGLSKKLPKNIAIAYSIQYQDIAKQIKQTLSKTNKITKFLQVLGCSKIKLPKQTQAILLITSGKFHAISLTLTTNLPIYILYNNQLEKISNKDIRKLKQKQKVAQLKFLNADKLGILISTKPGQQNLKKAITLKNSDKLKNKNSYLYIANQLNQNEFENFPQIQAWINTACPRLDMDNSKIINAENLKH